jgi:hypothetical protein
MLLLCRCGRFPPQVRTTVPVEGRFEHVIVSCNAATDHGIIWIENEAQKTLDVSYFDKLILAHFLCFFVSHDTLNVMINYHQLMEQQERSTSPPAQQKMFRTQPLNTKEEAINLSRAENYVFLGKEMASQGGDLSSPLDSPSTSTVSHSTSSSTSEQCEWDELVGTFLGDSVQDNELRQGGDREFPCSIVMGHLTSHCK